MKERFLHILRTAVDIQLSDEKGVIGRWIGWRMALNDKMRWMPVVLREEYWEHPEVLDE